MRAALYAMSTIPLVAIVAPVSPGLAKTELTGGRIPEWSKSSLAQKSPALLTLYNAAVCFHDRYRAEALELLESERGSSEEARLYGALVDGSNRASDEGRDHLVCFHNYARSRPNARVSTVRFASKGLLRGAIAEAFYNRARVRPRGKEPLAFGQSYLTAMARWPAASEMERNERVARWTAHCAAHAEPMLVHRIVSDMPGDKGETRALQALEPTFLRCLPQGQSLRVERLTMRTLLAEGLWRATRTHEAKFHNA